MSAAGGDLNFNANLIVVSQPSSNQIIVSAINQSDGTVMGSFTISNNNPGIAIIANPSYNDGNNITGGNVSTVFFNNFFADDGIMNFYSIINSELSDTDNQTIQEMISCPCDDTFSTSDITACDSYDWNGTTYTTSGSYTFTTTNSSGCDSTATLNLTINSATFSTSDITACDSYDWNGVSGSYTFTTTNSGCDSTATLNLTINSATFSTSDITACDSYDWNGTTYTTSGSYTFTTTNSSGCDSTATLNLTSATSLLRILQRVIVMGTALLILLVGLILLQLLTLLVVIVQLNLTINSATFSTWILQRVIVMIGTVLLILLAGLILLQLTLLVVIVQLL